MSSLSNFNAINSKNTHFSFVFNSIKIKVSVLVYFKIFFLMNAFLEKLINL